jgi:hypothetical protein
MKRLILANGSSTVDGLMAARVGDFQIWLERRLIWGPLQSDAQMKRFFGTRRERQRSPHWLDHGPQWRLEKIGAKGLGLIELCARFETIELWIDPGPNDQLVLSCLLHYLRPHQEIAARLVLCQSDSEIVERLAILNGDPRPPRSATIILNWQAEYGAPLARRRRRIGSAC